MPWELRDGEPVIDAAPVRALLAEQHPDLARHTIPAIPTPARTGVRGAGYPFRWAVVPWVAGTPAVHVTARARDAYAPDLAATLRSIHQPAPDAAPASAFRGVEVAEMADRFAQRRNAWVRELRGVSDQRVAILEAVWGEAPGRCALLRPRLWLHGDPHPNNTVLAGAGPGTGSAFGPPVLVDFGDLCADDPASDLGSALLHFSPAGRAAFSKTYDAGRAADEDPAARWARAHGWAAYYALIFAAQPPGEALRALGRRWLS